MLARRRCLRDEGWNDQRQKVVDKDKDKDKIWDDFEQT